MAMSQSPTTCKRCGTEASPDARYCSRCGRNLRLWCGAAIAVTASSLLSVGVVAKNSLIDWFVQWQADEFVKDDDKVVTGSKPENRKHEGGEPGNDDKSPIDGNPNPDDSDTGRRKPPVGEIRKVEQDDAETDDAADLARSEQERIRRAAEAAQEADRRRYLQNLTRATNRPGSGEVAVLVVGLDGGIDRKLTGQVAAVLNGRAAGGGGVTAFDSIFTDAFVTAGLFDQSFAGEADPLDRLGLAGHVDQVVLAKSSVTFAEPTNGRGMVTAVGKLEIRVIPLDAPGGGGTVTVTADGAGFSRDKAGRKLVEGLTAALAVKGVELRGLVGVIR